MNDCGNGDVPREYLPLAWQGFSERVAINGSKQPAGKRTTSSKSYKKGDEGHVEHFEMVGTKVVLKFLIFQTIDKYT